MKKALKWIFVFLLVFIPLTGIVIYNFFPRLLQKSMAWQYEKQSKVIAKSVMIDGYKYGYYEGGKGETLVLIHGFADRKISFVQVARWLTPHYHVIMPEVPGFGASKRDPKLNYSIRNQVLRFHKLFKKIGLKKFYMGGNSMGGHISAAYTLLYPKQVKRLLLLNAAGLEVHGKSPYKRTTKRAGTQEEFEGYMKKLFYKAPWIPGPYKKFLLEESKISGPWLDRIAGNLIDGKDHFLNDRISKIKVPTLILWGDHDRIVIPDVGFLYRKKLPVHKWIMMKKCGHVPQYERPEETAKHLLQFLKQKSFNK